MRFEVGALVWVENGRLGSRHPATVKARVAEGDEEYVEIAWSTTGGVATVPEGTIHQDCVDGEPGSRERRPPSWYHASMSDNQSITGEGTVAKKRALMRTNRPKTRAKSKKATKPGKRGSGKDTFYAVESILSAKKVDGKEYFLVRWKGYGEGEDTWEPAGNIAKTGHIDRYKRDRKRTELEAKVGTGWVVTVEYKDKLQDTIDLKEEKFRSLHRPAERKCNSEDGDGGTNNFSLVKKNCWIELLWPHLKMYHPCKIISCRKVRSSDRCTALRHHQS
jgi:hypothetical protein